MCSHPDTSKCEAAALRPSSAAFADASANKEFDEKVRDESADDREEDLLFGITEEESDREDGEDEEQKLRASMPVVRDVEAG